MKNLLLILLLFICSITFGQVQKKFTPISYPVQYNDAVKFPKLTNQSSPNAIPVIDSITKIIVGYVSINNSKNFSIDTITSNIVTINAVLNVTGNLTVVQLSGSLTDGAPTNAQIVAIIGKTAAQAGAGYTVTIKDTDGTSLLYRVESDGTNWFYHVTVKAL